MIVATALFNGALRSSLFCLISIWTRTEVNLVDARHVKNVTGRKTDVEDCQWLQQLHASGLLTRAFRLEDKILPLRSFMCHRQTLITASATAVQHMQKALAQMNLQLSNVLSDIAGFTGMRIIRAIIAGEREAKKLSEFRDPRCKKSIDLIEKSLTGNYREEHLFSLQQGLETFDFYQQQILNCDKKIEEALIQLGSSDLVFPKSFTEKESEGKAPRTYKKNGNIFYFNPLEQLKNITKVDLTKIPGIEANLALKIISEIGVDMKRWPSEKHFTSWLGLSPENKVSGGKRLSSKTKASANRAAEGFRLAAFSLYRSQTALGAFLRRIKSKQGPPIAITATARKIAVIFYSLLTKGVEYIEIGLNYYEEKYKERILKGLQKRAQDFGMIIVPSSNKERNDEIISDSTISCI